jgi:hypothetical protein
MKKHVTHRPGAPVLIASALAIVTVAWVMAATAASGRSASARVAAYLMTN